MGSQTRARVVSVKGGASDVPGFLDLPDRERFPGKRPWVFFLPATTVSSAAVEARFGNLFKRLQAEGVGVYRFAMAGEPRDWEEIEAHWLASHEQLEIDPGDWIFIGWREGADDFARDYFRFLRFGEPRAAVLLSTTEQLRELNQLTCPYLLIHGGKDPVFRLISGERYEEAVAHHRQRFTDSSHRVCFAGLDERLGDSALAPEVVEKIVDWLGHARRIGHRPQEPVAS